MGDRQKIKKSVPPTNKRVVPQKEKKGILSSKAFLAILIATLSVAIYLIFSATSIASLLPNSDSVATPTFNEHLTAEDWAKWNNLVSWLKKNGMPANFLLTLAYFKDSGRGVACTKDIEAETPVVRIPFKAMMPVKHARTETKLGKLIQKLKLTVTDDAMLALFLLSEKLDPNSFWRPYIDFLPTDYSEMAIFLTPEDKEYMEGLLEPTLNYEIGELNSVLQATRRVEAEEPVLFKGLSNETALRWALAAVWSRMWHIEEVGGRALVPLADLLNHHPEKGTILVPNADDKIGTIKALQSYKKGDEFYDKYFIEKVESDGVYYATYGFLLSTNYFSSYPVDYYWMHARHGNIRSLLELNGCTGYGTEKAAVTDLVEERGIPGNFVNCARIFALDEYEEVIDEVNYQEWIETEPVKKRAYELMLNFFKEKLAFYKTGTVEDDGVLLRNESLSRNARTLIKLRMSEKLVLNNTIIYIQGLLDKL